MAVGIDNLKACIVNVKAIADTLGVVFEDGKISITDLMQLPSLFKQVNVLIAAFPAASEEIKDLDLAEAQELIASVLDLVSALASKFGMIVK